MGGDRSGVGLPLAPVSYDLFINGRRTAGESTGFFERLSPGHGVPVSQIRLGSKADVDAAVEAARRAFEDGRWSRISGAERAEVLLRTARLIRDRLEELARLETLETGKPIKQSRDEISGAAGIWEYAAGAARMLHGDTFNNLGTSMLGLVTREPIGVVGIITPWNFPFFILSERLPFVLASGCTTVVKPSEYTSATTLRLADLLKEAGLPDGAVNVVTGIGPVVGQHLVEHIDVDMVSFTGSTNVGRSTLAASSKNLKKVGLELGGKNPQLVFNDADLDSAADAIAFGIAFNAGQCCVSGSRLIVERRIARELTERVVQVLSRAKLGDPLDATTQIGAIVNERQLERILSYVEAGASDGAKLVYGGGRYGSAAGLFMTPTVFENVTPEMSIARDEIFGPVLSVMTFDTFEEGIALANATDYGLAASIWSKDIDKALQAMRRVRAGRVWVNTTIAGGPELPIGGFKQSGVGRETGIYGVEEYTQIKSTHIQLGPRPRWMA